jgi:hypothetical protein
VGGRVSGAQWVGARHQHGVPSDGGRNRRKAAPIKGDTQTKGIPQTLRTFICCTLAKPGPFAFPSVVVGPCLLSSTLHRAITSTSF